MRKLIIQQDEISYSGFFSSPAFALWGEGVRILEGLYKAFIDYELSLSNISLDLSSTDSTSHGVKVDLNELGDYKFGFEQVEWTATDIGDDLIRIPEVLQHGEEWLRSVVPDFAFKLHVLDYHNHSLLSDGASEDFLSGLSNVDIPDVGISRGNGLIFHWELPEQGWRMNLTIDHSNLIPNGLFIEQEVIAQTDKIDYTRMIITSNTLLKNILTKIGLELENKAQ